MTKKSQHTPLFLKQIIALVNQYQVKRLVDATFGEGGHGLALAQLKITVLGIEADEQMYEVAKQNIQDSGLSNVQVIHGNYRDIAKIIKKAGMQPVDAIIMDLGLSMYQLKYSDKGFSSQRQGNLDLRLSEKQQTKASEIVNKSKEAQLQDLLTRYVESPYSQKLVQKILTFRQRKPINTVSDLQTVINTLGLDTYKAQNLLRQTLQALRIVVNDEFASIKQALSQLETVLAPHGLLIMLTYHSLEDRLVKQFVKKHLPHLKQVDRTIQNKDYQFAQGGKLRIYEQIIV